MRKRERERRRVRAREGGRESAKDLLTTGFCLHKRGGKGMEGQRGRQRGRGREARKERRKGMGGRGKRVCACLRV